MSNAQKHYPSIHKFYSKVMSHLHEKKIVICNQFLQLKNVTCSSSFSLQREFYYFSYNQYFLVEMFLLKNKNDGVWCLCCFLYKATQLP